MSFELAAHTQRPIFVGPWREEIGTEVLYWLPYVAHWCATHGVKPERLIAISRGGAGVWYGAGKAIELYDYCPPDLLRIEALRGMRRGTVKQTAMTTAERRLYPLIAARLGIRRYHVLHPRQMYAALRPWMGDRLSLADATTYLRFAPIATPILPLTVSLPERFACVRFYQRNTWMLTEEVKDYCVQLVGQLAKQIPVVVIGSSAHHDDHLDLNFTGPNITSMVDAFPLRENLALQSAVIAKSQCFVGTYGGTMQLAVRLGKPAVGFYLHFKGTAYAHKSLTEWLAMQQQTPIFIGTPAHAELVRSMVSVPLELPQPPGSSSGAMPV